MEKHTSPKVFVYNTGERLKMIFAGVPPEREFQRGCDRSDRGLGSWRPLRNYNFGNSLERT